MRIVCITVDDDSYERIHGSSSTLAEMWQHFAARGVDAQFFKGIHAAKLGLATTRPYTCDDPTATAVVEPGVVGCWLSHRSVWAALLALTPPDEELFLILEDDAVFPENWKARLDEAVRDAGDFDLLFVGSCCTFDKPKEHVRGDVYLVTYPFCLHGLVVRRRALSVLIETSDAAGLYAPIDISLVLHTLSKLMAYTVLPPILTQRNLILP